MSPAPTCVGRLDERHPGRAHRHRRPRRGRNPGAVALTVVAPAASGSNATPPSRDARWRVRLPGGNRHRARLPNAARRDQLRHGGVTVTDRHRHARRPRPDRLRRAETARRVQDSGEHRHRRIRRQRRRRRRHAERQAGPSHRRRPLACVKPGAVAVSVTVPCAPSTPWIDERRVSAAVRHRHVEKRRPRCRCTWRDQ